MFGEFITASWRFNMLWSQRISALLCHRSAKSICSILVRGRSYRYNSSALSADASTTSSKPIPNLTIVNDCSSLDLLDEAVSKAIIERRQFGCSFEGIYHGRYGQLQLIALSVRDPEYRYFLVDVGNNISSEDAEKYMEDRSIVLKRLFESTMVEKVIHDCRLPSDALYHNHKIRLTNVHDTTRYYMVSTGKTVYAEELTLKMVLGNCNLAPEPFPRDNAVLQKDPKFWATRPITPTMMQWAYSRVYPLLLVAIHQWSCLTTRDVNLARRRSERFCDKLRTMKLATGVRLGKPTREFTGQKRKTIKHLNFKTTTYIYEVDDFWNVYYDDIDSLMQVKKAMGLYTPRKESSSNQNS